MIDYDVISDEFIRIAKLAVGTKLSEIGPEGGPLFPAVIKSRQNGPKPDFHYIIFDILTTVQTKGWLLQSGLDGEDSFWETDKTLLMQFTVFGDDAHSIANELEGYFRYNRIRDDIRAATDGALVQTFEVISTPQSLANKFVEASLFNLTFSIVDRVTDTDPAPEIGTGVFDTIILDGELARSQDDTDPLPLDITVTSVAP